MNEADLGGYLFKKRIARADGGKISQITALIARGAVVELEHGQ